MQVEDNISGRLINVIILVICYYYFIIIILLFYYLLLLDSKYSIVWVYPVQFSSVAQSCLTLCDPMDCSIPGLPVHH